MKRKVLTLILALTILTSLSNIAFGEIDPPPIRQESIRIVHLPY